ncbi:branched-chain amino acid ABC transporter substrate-binding protein [Paraburkholderia silviterrae]|uniref:Branched-chain amino acid ABC transporter substrate-binding protein n=1 Tax=Paraburkholderia silviterrae TaxID=2528715 RepID=A0A4R5M5E6_9BURK|nr:branched-chain amino acid ABC transporter substrate-binding protein [Paraburkholderia silviterrae]TDG20645.1 branched-chain amino acid ABC transporter substrate-binding protein [Paraburkholderia silviterrae]
MNRRQTCMKLMAAGVLGLASLYAVAGDEQVVRIGLTGPLTGSQAAIGKDDENGVRLAIERLNARGLVIGGKKTHFELDSQDDAGDPRTGMTVAQNLLDANVKVIFGPFNSGVAIPISNLVNNASIVMATVASNPSITQHGYPFVFRISASDTQLGSRMGDFAARQLKVTRVAVVDDRTAYGQGVADEFVRSAKANGIQIVDREYTTDKATDFMSILTRIKGANAQAIFYGGYYAQAGALRRQMKRLGMNGYLMGGDAICNAELGKLGGDAVDERVYCPQGGPVLAQTPEGRQFMEDYRKRFATDPLTYSAALYDGMNLVAQAMEKANSIDPEKYRAALVDTNFQGISGHYQFDGNRDLLHSPITIYTYREGVPSPTKQ